MKAKVNSNGLILPAVLVLICIIGVIVNQTTKITSRFYWLIKAVKQEGQLANSAQPFDINNPCKNATCLRGDLAIHSIFGPKPTVFSMRTKQVLPSWTKLEEASMKIQCARPLNFTRNDQYLSAYNCTNSLKTLLEADPKVYFAGNYSSSQSEEISRLKSKKIALIVKGSLDIKTLVLTKLEDVSIEVIAVGPITIDNILLSDSKNTAIFLYSALGKIVANTNNQISLDCAKDKSTPGLLIPEATKTIKINGISLSQSVRSCLYSKDLSFWPTNIQIGK